MINLPVLPPCPKHPEGSKTRSLSDCNICWNRFYFYFEFEKVVARINKRIKEYMASCIPPSYNWLIVDRMHDQIIDKSTTKESAIELMKDLNQAADWFCNEPRYTVKALNDF